MLCYRQQLTLDPSLRSRVRSYLHANGWLGLRLTGERAFDRANASFTGLYGTLTDQKWSPRWCDYFQVDASWLPPVWCGSTTLGALRPSLAGELGVPAGIPVKLDLYEGMWHIFQVFNHELPESKLARKKVRAFLEQHVGK